MESATRRTLRHYLATPHAPLTVLELQNLLWYASALVDELQQELERLDAPLESEGDPPDNEEHASSRGHKLRVDKQPPIL